MDENINKVVKTFMITDQDLSHFWKIFQKLDKAKTGLVSLNYIFTKIEAERNLISDCLLEMLEIEHEGEINFSDFVYMVATYCFFEPREILKFCFYVFDQDKTGFFSVDDLNNLVNAVHNITGGATVQGTVKASWMKLTFTGDEFEFEEFSKIHNAFPRLFEPAFRLQTQMRHYFMGEGWWEKKKRVLERLKEIEEAKEKAAKAKKERKKAKKKARKTLRAMGALRYYLCPCMRKYYDPTLTAYDQMTAEEKAQRDKEIAYARRQAELRVKNPETAAWKQYQEKVAKESQIVAIDEEDEGKTNEEGGNAAAATATATATAAVDDDPNAALKEALAAAAREAKAKVNPKSRRGQELAKKAEDEAKNAQYLMPSAGKKTVTNAYLDQKISHTRNERGKRQESRAERKRRRDDDPELKQKSRTTVSGAEI